MKGLALACIRFYQASVSPFGMAACRFQPTCSHYSYQAITRHGLMRGLGLTAWRLVRCNPINTGGYDPVP